MLRLCDFYVRVSATTDHRSAHASDGPDVRAGFPLEPAPAQAGAGMSGKIVVSSRQRSTYAVDDVLHGKRGEQHAKQARGHDIGGSAKPTRDARGERKDDKAKCQNEGD